MGGRFAPVARSPLHRQLRDDGARLDQRDGWWLATDFGEPERETQRLVDGVGYADRSALGKLEVHAAPGVLAVLAGGALALGSASRTADGWCCPVTRERALVVCEPAVTARLRDRLERSARDARGPASVVDLTAGYAAVAVVGPLARETFARLTAIDLRPAVTPPGAFRPGSVARVPGMLLCEAPDRYLLFFGSAHAHYMWTALSDAARHLGGGPVGLNALAGLQAPSPEVAADA